MDPTRTMTAGSRTTKSPTRRWRRLLEPVAFRETRAILATRETPETRTDGVEGVEAMAAEEEGGTIVTATTTEQEEEDEEGEEEVAEVVVAEVVVAEAATTTRMEAVMATTTIDPTTMTTTATAAIREVEGATLVAIQTMDVS